MRRRLVLAVATCLSIAVGMVVLHAPAWIVVAAPLWVGMFLIGYVQNGVA